MFPNASGILFFGANSEKSIAWNAIDAIPEIVMDETNIAEEQTKIFATMRNSQTVTMNCHISKKAIKNMMGLVRGFKLAKGPARNRMIRRAKKMQTNYIYEYEFIKEGNEYVDKRGKIRLILQ